MRKADLPIAADLASGTSFLRILLSFKGRVLIMPAPDLNASKLEIDHDGRIHVRSGIHDSVS
jgi:hypothetical protein